MKRHTRNILFAFTIILTTTIARVAFADLQQATTLPPGNNATTVPEDAGNYSFLAPISYLIPSPDGGFGGQNLVSLTDNSQDPLTTYIRNAIKLAIGIAGVFGVIRLVGVGFEVVTKAGSIDAQTRIKKEIGAIVGSLVLIAGSWIFLNTINPQLVGSAVLIDATSATGTTRSICTDAANCAALKAAEDSDGAPMNNVDSRGNPIPDIHTTKGLDKGLGFYFLVQQPNGDRYWAGPFTKEGDCTDKAALVMNTHNSNANSDTVILAQGQTTPTCMYNNLGQYQLPGCQAAEQAGRQRLDSSDPKVYVLHGACNNFEGCTDLCGLGDSTFSMLQSLAHDCAAYNGNKDCHIMINGGTEPGHNTHGLSHPYTVDINKNKMLHDFLWAKADYIAGSFKGNVRFGYTGPGGVWWLTDEQIGSTGTSNHYHTCLDGEPENLWYCNKYYAIPSKQNVSPQITTSNCKVNSDKQSNPTQQDCRYIDGQWQQYIAKYDY